MHTLQALIYVAVIMLTHRRSAWGYGAGAMIAAFWNYTNLFVTTFIVNGLQELSLLVRTGQLHRPDLLVAIVAAAGHFLMIGGCVAGLLRLRPGMKQFAHFLLGGALAIGCFVLIIVTTGRQYIPLLRRIFRLA